MQHIDAELLEAIFAQSHLELHDSEREMWLRELNHWVDFFSMDHFAWDVPAHSGEGRVVALRPDVVEKGLESSQVKNLCLRFVDGFIALPKGNNKEGASSGS